MIDHDVDRRDAGEGERGFTDIEVGLAAHIVHRCLAGQGSG